MDAPAILPSATAPLSAIPTTTTNQLPAISTPTVSTAATPSALQEILFGSIAGTLGKLVEFPFDTIKVRLQSQPDRLPLRYTGPLDCFRQSLAAEGVRGLYRGVSAPLAGAAAETACLFWSYGVAKEGLREYVWRGEGEDVPLQGLVLAGAASGAVTSLVLTPIELVKCRMQVPMQSSSVDLSLKTPASGLSPLTVIRTVFAQEGLAGFWRGQLGTFLRETGGTAAWFGSYEASTSYLKRRIRSSTRSEDPVQLPLGQQLAAGALAGMSYNFLFYPADTIKSKIQTGELTTHGRQTFLGVGRELWRAHGMRGLYRGCGITVLRSAPSSALIFMVVEELKRAFA